MISQVSPLALDDWMSSVKTHGQPVVLDVREPWELQTASIRPDAAFEFLSIPMGDVPTQLARLDPARPVAVLCHHGGRSLRVAHFLAHNGFEHVANLAGGIDAWALERDPAVPRYA